MTHVDTYGFCESFGNVLKTSRSWGTVSLSSILADHMQGCFEGAGGYLAPCSGAPSTSWSQAARPSHQRVRQCLNRGVPWDCEEGHSARSPSGLVVHAESR